MAATVANESGSWPIRNDPCESQTYYYRDYVQISGVQYAFVVCYVLVLTVSLFGNFFVMWSVWKHKHMRTGTNIYIVNLAVSDFLVALFVMPLKLLEYTAPCSWKVFSRDSLCSFVYFTLPVFVFASVLTLVAISVDRFYAVVYPLRRKTASGGKRRQIFIIFSAWFVAILLSLPYLYCRSYAFNIRSEYGAISRQICTDRFDDIDEFLYGKFEIAPGKFRKGFFLFLFVAVYVLPSVVIMYTCIRMALELVKPQDFRSEGLNQRLAKNQADNKRRVARIVIFVSMAFIISWTPFYLVSFVSQIQGPDSFLKRSNFLFVMITTHFIGFINSGINPLIYVIMSKKFRRSFFVFFGCLPVVRRLLQQWNIERTSVRSSEAGQQSVAYPGDPVPPAGAYPGPTEQKHIRSGRASEPIIRYKCMTCVQGRAHYVDGVPSAVQWL